MNSSGKMKYIDINADLGEGAGHDEQLMPLISSCSIACGGHFGDRATMQVAVDLAKQFGVKVGAHPSFPDKDHFGRKQLVMTKNELTETVLRQISDFIIVCTSEDHPVNHVKLHGALYQYAASDAPAADAVVDAILATAVRPKLYVPYGSILHKKAENLLPLVFEAFIDRSYTDELSLVGRQHPGAVIRDPETAWQQLFGMVTRGVVSTISGTEKKIVAGTFCVHGDHENSVPILEYIHRQMEKHSITLA